MARHLKMKILKCCWSPDENCDFAADAIHSRRKFRHEWLKTSAPWFTYSISVKGALCLYCVLYPPASVSVEDVLGSFIIKPFTSYYVMHEACKHHFSYQWYKASVIASKKFLENDSVNARLASGNVKETEEKRNSVNNFPNHILWNP
ncbi:uncharacterized protein LOC118179975 [Stegodyphus dumicola]|uniref:uncharacterized protein LOC118179975 n=1 Tax=Stegodyphus dumicola TaxID=202533 RepID=UPI0015AE8D4D|nr:uncharacterized protein LOC118179975 [Stegodyphus dumicola]